MMLVSACWGGLVSNLLALLLDHVSSSAIRNPANDSSHLHRYLDTLCRAAHLDCDDCDESGHAIRAALSYLKLSIQLRFATAAWSIATPKSILCLRTL
jgi:hypothetical protein